MKKLTELFRPTNLLVIITLIVFSNPSDNIHKGAKSKVW